MGSLCSKSGTVTGGHQILGSGPSGSSTTSAAPPRPVDPRRAAAEAAERRQREVGHRKERIASRTRGGSSPQIRMQGGLLLNWKPRNPSLARQNRASPSDSW
ncbi:hypothetical protein GSI_06678 [Ganoderma sinense ZZ0214-1]|uniref:Uncharacterized protein n=1 Tax=Ganoderma sinense ZZ0214-1 TaxID=1077348 RepID=A0A2G8SDX4_9APHY|nr:hypothetical protein GSI_06678 [Ganoderma sinense ZZ0214-1]